MADIRFREALTKYTLVTLSSGYSVSLVGVGSVGKSNFLRHLLKPEVQSAFLGPEAENLHLIYIDPNNMLESLPPINGTSQPTSWVGYEIMTQRMYRHFFTRQATTPPQIEQALAQAYQQLHNGANPLTGHVALRHFEYAVDLIVRSGSRIVFVFDEFEEMMKELPTKFFRTLRGLRDDYKYQLAYLTCTRKTMPDLITEHSYDYDALEPYIELFSDTTRFITAYGMKDALDVLNQMGERQMVKLSDKASDLLVRISGGHAGLMRAAFSVHFDLAETANEEENADRLARYRATQAESHTIWLSLNTAEQETLMNLLTGRGQVDPRSIEVNTLAEKQLLKKLDNGFAITPPLFRSYLKSHINP